MKNCLKSCLVSLLFCACNQEPEIVKYGKHFQKHNDYESLIKVVELIPPNTDKSYVRTILGEPIDMGFDYRYMLDSIGPNGCSVGAVFHIDENGKVDQKWIDEVCE